MRGALRIMMIIMIIIIMKKRIVVDHMSETMHDYNYNYGSSPVLAVQPPSQLLPMTTHQLILPMFSSRCQMRHTCAPRLRPL